MLPTTSLFQRYDFTQEELKAAVTFSDLQKALLNDLIAQIAEEKIGIEFDLDNPSKFMQREAELKGQIGILQYLLSLNQSVSE